LTFRWVFLVTYYVPVNDEIWFSGTVAAISPRVDITIALKVSQLLVRPAAFISMYTET
jgi:hypothetical protein